ncbi:unnamed protein product [Nezara viridula]|uniref:Uncharacterized protein n=1 Tax=Nezara viridula TaxID=85310 RepID=A0A9P0EEB0_NEZVI|nr:unnamed protein product [Nezara viridula]
MRTRWRLASRFTTERGGISIRLEMGRFQEERHRRAPDLHLATSALRQYAASTRQSKINQTDGIPMTVPQQVLYGWHPVESRLIRLVD